MIQRMTMETRTVRPELTLLASFSHIALGEPAQVWRPGIDALEVLSLAFIALLPSLRSEVAPFGAVSPSIQLRAVFLS